MRKEVNVHDIETISNLFLICLYNIKTHKKKHFIVHEFKNDIEEFIKYLDNELIHISYNGLSFDGQVIQWIWENRAMLLKCSGDDAARKIYGFAQSIIEKSNKGEFLPYNESNLKIREIDLFKIWHFDNKAKATSLKWIQFMIDWKDVREMPINHYDEVTTLEQIEEVLSYCYNDVMSSYELLKITRGITDISEYKGKDKIEFRESIMKIISKNCINWNDVKIGAELNLINYIKSFKEKYGVQTNKQELKDSVLQKESIDLKDCIPDYITFKTKQLQELLERVKATTVTLQYSKIKDEDDIEYDDEYEELTGKKKPKKKWRIKETGKVFEELIIMNSTHHKMKLGGIHSCERGRIVVPTSNQKLEDADVGSQYPSALAKRRKYPSHLDVVWCENITFNIIKRIDLKPLSKKDKQVAAFCEAIKLSLNGGAYGKLGESNDWQYDPECMYSVTIGCQFEILMLIEELELAGIRVISSNTDGIVSVYDRSLEDTYYRICKEWEAKVLVEDKQYGKLEFQEYSKIIQTSVNDYIAVKPNGEIKKKGDFMTEFELHKNKSKKIIPLALEHYFTKNGSVKQFIKNHTNIFDFCIGVKSKGNWYYEARQIKDGYHHVERLQKVNRYYISNGGVKIIKCNPDKKNGNQAEAGKWLQTVFNNYVEKSIDSYNINYEYYINSVFDIIHKIDNNVTVNFTQANMF